MVVRNTTVNLVPHEKNAEVVTVRGVQDGEIIEAPIEKLLPAHSPRLAEHEEHIIALAEVDAELPPILVHRDTLRVIDGMHRLRAAQRRGFSTIAIRYFDGDEREAFVLSVRLNSAHGLPLTLADRKNAALRIMSFHPEWSDRAIAALVSVSDKTVAALRRREGDRLPQPAVRVGRNNETYRLNSVQGRLRASELFQQNPDFSTREIARLADISVTAAKDVRNRLLRGDDPVPARQRKNAGGAPGTSPATTGGQVPRPPFIQLSRLRTDPSLRYSDAGRTLLRWLEALGNNQSEWAEIAESVPSHCAPAVAQLARQRAEDWRNFAMTLERRNQAAS